MNLTTLPRHRAASPGLNPATIEVVVRRDRSRCTCCGKHVTGRHGDGWIIHLRRPAPRLLPARPGTYDAPNLMLACTSCIPTLGDKVEARRNGWRLPQSADPTMAALSYYPADDDGNTPVAVPLSRTDVLASKYLSYRWCYLTAVGGRSLRAPELMGEPLYGVWVHGARRVLAAASYDHAVQLAADINARWATRDTERWLCEPLELAEVCEWPYDRAEHAAHIDDLVADHMGLSDHDDINITALAEVA